MSRRAAYKEVAPETELSPLQDDAADDDDFQPTTKADQWLEFAWRKLNALLWISVAGALAYFIQLPHVILHGHVPSRPQHELDRCAPPTHSFAGVKAWRTKHPQVLVQHRPRRLRELACNRRVSHCMGQVRVPTPSGRASAPSQASCAQDDSALRC